MVHADSAEVILDDVETEDLEVVALKAREELFILALEEYSVRRTADDYIEDGNDGGSEDDSQTMKWW
ncbi:hypothetical protein TWF481_002650 [Arthrobotrys musiformis]|uniref:Uncharacterized protein n=1 Tax=Arthrobotrys musiformis TaxID=47236 RepID=A0AAV9VS15_9PEZI